MADPDPNPNVNTAGSGVVLHVQRPDGEFVPVQGTDAGAIAVTGGGGGETSEVTGPGGEELSTEVTADRTADATEALATTIAAGGVPTPGQAAIAIVNVDPPQNFAAAPNEGTELQAIYIAGTAPFLLDRDLNPRATFLEANSAEIATNTGLISGQLPEDLGGAGGLKTELVAPLPAGTNALGTVEVTASALPSGAATSALQGAGLPGALTAGGGVKVGLVDALPAGANAIGSVSISSSALPSGAATEATLATRASETTLSAINTKIPASPSQEHVTAASPHAARLSDGSAFYDAAKAGDNLGADLRVAGAAVANGNPVPISDAGVSITTDTPQLPAALGAGGGLKVDGSGTPLPVSGTVTANVGTTGGLALDATLTGGTQIAIAKGPVTPGAAVGGEKPVLVGGSDGTNAQIVNVDSTGAVRLQSGGTPGATAPTRATQIGGSDGTNLRALKVDASGRPDVTVFGTVDTELPAAAALADQTSNPTAPAIASFPSNWDPNGAQWNRTQGLPNGAQIVAFDRSHLGAFGHLMSQSVSFIAQITFTYGLNTFFGTTAASGTGATVDANSGLLRVQCGTSNTGNASYTANRPILYRAGQGMGMVWSGAFTTGLTGNTTIAGPSTTNQNADGYFFGYKGTTFGIHHYRGGSEVSFTAQASWNGMVPVGFDPTKLNLFEVRYPFLGAGNVYFFVADGITGRPFLVHTIRYANTSTSLQLSNPTLRFLLRSTNTSNTTNLTAIVGSVASYIVGDRHFNGPPFVFNFQKAVTGGAETNIFSMRAATTLNGVANRGAARVRLSTAVGDNGNTITAFLVRNGATVGGTPAFTPYSGSTGDNGVTLTNANSMLSFDVAGTTSAGGTPILNTGCARNSVVPFDLSDLDIIVLPGETWTFAANPGANSNCAVFVNGIEEW